MISGKHHYSMQQGNKIVCHSSISSIKHILNTARNSVSRNRLEMESGLLSQ